MGIPAELWKGIAMPESIEIIDLDLARSRNPDPSKAMYDMYLVLSGTPDTNWRQIFDYEYASVLHNMKRRAQVRGEFIVVHCPPDEVEKYHMPHLRQTVKNTNEKYAAYIIAQEQKLAQQKTQKEAAELAERERLEGIQQRLFGNREVNQ